VQGDNLNFNEYSFGVELYLPATQYQKSDRTAKYGALVISLVFLIIFFVQIMRKVGVHPFQYILIGLALVIFYTLLLSISEFTTFNAAYLLAAGLVVVLISVYLHGVLQNLRTTGIIFLLQTLIFGFIYVIIQLEDTAFLIGSIGLFITLAVAMIASRKVDWYNLQKR
jgi:inner membrane protein